MDEKLRILGLIPARGGSKRIPGKNIRMLGGMPLIAWTIRTAIKSQVFIDVVVSTDDQKIVEIAKQYGATVPGLRPAELATDTATSVDVAIHALDDWESRHGIVDGIMLLQPTSPFRRAETVRQAAKLFQANRQRPVVSLSPAKSHPAWCFQIKQGAMTPLLGGGKPHRRSQDLSPAYVLNGAVYIVPPGILRLQRTFITADTCPLIMQDVKESLDIDTEWDWMIADTLLSLKNG